MLAILCKVVVCKEMRLLRWSKACFDDDLNNSLVGWDRCFWRRRVYACELTEQNPCRARFQGPRQFFQSISKLRQFFQSSSEHVKPKISKIQLFLTARTSRSWKFGPISICLTIQFAIQLCSIQLKTHPRDYFLRLKRLSKKQNFLFLLAEIKLSWNVPILNWRMSFPPRRKWPMTLQHHSKIKVKRQTKLLGQPTSAWKKEGTWACKWANSIANKGSMIDFKTDIIL